VRSLLSNPRQPAAGAAPVRGLGTWCRPGPRERLGRQHAARQGLPSLGDLPRVAVDRAMRLDLSRYRGDRSQPQMASIMMSITMWAPHADQIDPVRRTIQHQPILTTAMNACRLSGY
jgi:hypothetical protein